MPLSILFVTAMYPHPARPGSGAFVMHQAEQLRALAHHVDVVHVKGYRSKWNYLKGAVDVLRATWRRRYDVVHVHYGLTGLCALVRWRAPMVVTLHGSDVLQGMVQPLISRVVARAADATIAVSPDIAARYPGTVIPCGVDLEKFRPGDRDGARRALGLTPTGKYVLFPFNPDRRLKRYDLSKDAVESLRAEGLDVSILPVWNESNDRMPLYYAAADVMILCSDTEGSPTSVKEALACDLPVVSTDVGDVRTLLQGIEGVELCEQRVESIARALRRVLERSNRTTFDGRSAMRRYDLAQTAQALLEVYGTVLQGDARARRHAV
jgi:glycosyltransferase involved in cell wall biosynthesis